jgi:UDP-3-O-[3-hydroxymyristoyl] glucosamine N-acyltransferase
VSNIEKRDLYIFGCSGIAKSLIDSILNINAYNPSRITLVDKDDALSGTRFYRNIPVISFTEFSNKAGRKGDYICTFFKPYDIFNRLVFARGIESIYDLKPITVVDLRANISSTAQIGRGVYIAPGVVVDAEANIGDHSIVLFNSIISRECTLEKNNFISSSVVIKGGVFIGANNFISSNCVITKKIGSCNFINSGIVLNRDNCERMLVGLKATYVEISLPSSDSAAEKKLRFLNP